MAKIWKYSIGLVAIVAGAALSYISYQRYQQKIESSYNSGVQDGKMQGIDETLQEIKLNIEDINSDGLEDFCILLPPKSTEQIKRMICRIDYNNDCIQDTVYVSIDEQSNPEIVNQEAGKRKSGICTSRPIPQTIHR
ncbi:MAG: hypothetical protein A2X67_08605 [Ignavibacteria bacterium GWA2_55_11]|nr:hypothetical protein [Candidatus Woesearchaeota archaeon]OGU30230.1 MAG: hypothetical protein A2X67_08605 [Ignavibacteria bacterium GWA2_55_11]